MKRLVLAGAILAIGGAFSGIAAQPIPLDRFEFATPEPVLGAVDQMAWTAGALHRVLSEQDYTSVVALSALGRAMEESGPSALDGTDRLVGMLAGGPGSPRDRCRAERSPVDGALCSIEQMIPVAPRAVANGMVEDGARLVALQGASGATDPLQGFAEQALGDVWNLRTGATNLTPADRGAFDRLLVGAVGFAPGAGVGAILSGVPALDAALREYPILSGLGGAPVPAIGGSAFGAPGSADAVLGEYRSFLGSVTGSLGGPVSLGASDLALDWAGQRSFIYLAGQSAALAGAAPDVVDRIRTVGFAAADLHRSASGLSSGLGAMGGRVALAAMSGDVLSIVASLTSFFGASPGALGPGAAGEVRALREGVEDMRREMHGRFDDMDHRFDDLLASLGDGLGRLERLVASNSSAVRQDLQELHQDVLALYPRLDRMEENLYSYMQAGFDRDYSRTLVRCLEYRDRLLPPFDRMEFPVFQECLADFRTRAVVDARDALLADRATATDDVSLAVALADPSFENLARRLPLLARTADQRFAVSGMGAARTLANPFEWAVATEAYLTLLDAWPEHARAVAPGDLEAMRAVGLDLRATLENLTRPSAAGGGTFAEAVLGYYRHRVSELTAEADVLARRHQQAQLRRVAPESLFTRIVPTEPGRPSLEVPSRILASVPQEIRTAAVLALGEASLVYRLHFEDQPVRQNFRRRMLIFGKRHDRLTYTRTRVEIELRFGEMGTIAVYRAFGPPVLRRTEEMAGDERSEKVVATRVHIEDPWTHFVSEVWPALSTGPDALVVTPSAIRSLRMIENSIEEELRRHATVALNAVFSEVCRDFGTPGNLTPSDRESADRIRASLDGLTGARSLLQAYVRLALPFFAETDPALAASLFGPSAILNREALCVVVAVGESPLRMVWLEEEPIRRAAVLAEALEEVLREHAEAPRILPLVDSTLQRIETAIRVQRLRAAVAQLGV